MHSRQQLNIVPKPAKKLTIVLTGGGSGGHITPLLAVASELKKNDPNSKLIFIGQTGDKLIDIPKKHTSIDRVYTVRAGKFRRYHGQGATQLLDIKTLAKNIRDFFYLLVGLVQSYRLLRNIKPNVIFVRGSFVGVPVCLAAALQKIPYITHDSDAVPSLTTRLISRWATAHAVALPKEVYKYPPQKTFTVGVPISNKFHPVSKPERNKYKIELGLPPPAQILLVTGGGHGALRLNLAVAQIAPMLLAANSDLIIIHATGRDHAAEMSVKYDNQLAKPERARVKVHGFFEGDLYKYSAVADVVITRAGATSLAEFAAQHKACVVVPNPQLTGGHQLKNASYLAKQKAVLTIGDSEVANNPEKFIGLVQKLLSDTRERKRLGEKLGHFAKPRASKELAELLTEAAKP